VFLFPFQDVHRRNHESFPNINFKSCAESTSRLSTDSIAVLEDSYTTVVVNVIDLALNWPLFSDVGTGGPRSFVNVMSTNSTLDPVSTVLCRMLM